MKNKMLIVYGVLAVLLLVTGFVVYKALFMGPSPSSTTENASPTPAVLPTVDSSVTVKLEKAAKANSVDLSVSGLAGKYTSLGYELSYESKGLIKGVNSGSSPVDLTGKSEFSKEVYLGTCSKNDCTPDTGVTKISVTLEFTDSTGAKSQFAKDFDL